MINWKIDYYISVIKKELPAIDSTIRKRILKNIDEKLKTQPGLFGKPLRGEMAGFWSLRVGDYRVIYKLKIEKRIITITHINHG